MLEKLHDRLQSESQAVRNRLLLLSSIICDSTVEEERLIKELLNISESSSFIDGSFSELISFVINFKSSKIELYDFMETKLESSVGKQKIIVMKVLNKI